VTFSSVVLVVNLGLSIGLVVAFAWAGRSVRNAKRLYDRAQVLFDLAREKLRSAEMHDERARERIACILNGEVDVRLESGDLARITLVANDEGVTLHITTAAGLSHDHTLVH
jgi:hypothetical protein